LGIYKSIVRISGDRASRGRGFTEHFRLGPDAHVHDTQYQVAPRLDTTQAIVGSSVHGDNAPSAVGGAWWAQIPARNSFQDHYNSYYSQQPVRRRDTDYFWRADAEHLVKPALEARRRVREVAWHWREGPTEAAMKALLAAQLQYCRALERTGAKGCKKWGDLQELLKVGRPMRPLQ
jgi:hypothetical protein